jgi:hypothetical protein
MGSRLLFCCAISYGMVYSWALVADMLRGCNAFWWYEEEDGSGARGGDGAGSSSSKATGGDGTWRWVSRVMCPAGDSNGAVAASTALAAVSLAAIAIVFFWVFTCYCFRNRCRITRCCFTKRSSAVAMSVVGSLSMILVLVTGVVCTIVYAIRLGITASFCMLALTAMIAEIVAATWSLRFAYATLFGKRPEDCGTDRDELDVAADESVPTARGKSSGSPPPPPLRPVAASSTGDFVVLGNGGKHE